MSLSASLSCYVIIILFCIFYMPEFWFQVLKPRRLLWLYVEILVAVTQDFDHNFHTYCLFFCTFYSFVG